MTGYVEPAPSASVAAGMASKRMVEQDTLQSSKLQNAILFVADVGVVVVVLLLSYFHFHLPPGRHLSGGG